MIRYDFSLTLCLIKVSLKYNRLEDGDKLKDDFAVIV